MSHLNLFAVAGLLLACTCFFLALIIFLARKSALHKVWFLFNIAVGLWAVGAFFIGIEKNPVKALLIWRFTEVSVAFIAVFFLNVTLLACKLSAPNLLRFAYLQGLVFSILSLTSDMFFPEVTLVFNSFYYTKAGPLFYIFFIIWMGLVSYSQVKLFLSFLKSKGELRNQLLYLIVATLVGFTGGATNFFPHFELNLYPFGNLTIILYCVIVTYATLRYRLLDINLFITRTSIFIAVYSIVLGIPFAIAFGPQQKLINYFGSNWWTVPLMVSTILATGGPFIYLYITRRAEDRILQEQRRYQATLRQASRGMGKIKEINKLLSLIVHIVTRAVHLEHSIVFIADEANKKFVIGATRGKNHFIDLKEIDFENLIIDYFRKNKDPLVYEEIKHRIQDYDDPMLNQIERVMFRLNAALIVSSFVDDRLLGLLVLGRKRSGKLYSQDDLIVFSILANQAALAIENALFYENVKKTQEALFKAEKMATIGTMADGLSHQINNRLHAMGFIASDALDTIKLKRQSSNFSSETTQLVEEMESAFKKIQENVAHGGEIVQGLLRYTRKGDRGFSAVDLEQLIKSSFEMAQFKVKLSQLSIIKDYPKNISQIRGNFTQLQEVFFNLIDNAYDAMMQRKAENSELNYKPILRISAVARNGKINVCVEDNGIGVRKEDKNLLFTPFFTTKLSSKKGTGLGLYVIQKIIEDNHGGKVRMESEYMKGTKIYIELPT